MLDKKVGGGKISFVGSNSVLTRVSTPFDMTVTSNTGINDSKYCSAVSSNPSDAEFLGWYELTQDTVFNVSIERHDTTLPEPGVVI